MTEGRDAADGLRIDRWLWQARFFKSKSGASSLCTRGRVRVDGRVIKKAHYAVRPGAVLTFPQAQRIRVVRVLALGTRRGPATEAEALYQDMSPDTPPGPGPGTPGAPKRDGRRRLPRGPRP